jgi:hypothetical protein
MPFGGQHADASQTLQMVEARLAKNRSLAARLSQTFRHVLSSRNGSPFALTATIQIKTSDLISLYEHIARGLAFFHWGITLPEEEVVVRAAFLRTPANEMTEALLAARAAKREKVDLGEGAFLYEGAQAVDCPQITV